MSAQHLLTRAGWFLGRRRDVCGDLHALVNAGFMVGPAVPDFLAEYSGLSISSPNSVEALLIDGLQASRHADPEWSAAYAAAIGLAVTPVGEYSHMIILLDEEGRLWGGYDFDYGFLG